VMLLAMRDIDSTPEFHEKGSSRGRDGSDEPAGRNKGKAGALRAAACPENRLYRSRVGHRGSTGAAHRKA